MTIQTNPHQWLAVYVKPKHEKRVAEHFVVRDITHFLPLHEAVHRWRDRSKVSLRLPLFPGYIFVRLAQTSRVPVLEVPGVLSILGAKGGVPEISDEYVESLREGLRLGKVRPHPYLFAGTRVRVKSGLMAGMYGVLIRQTSSLRVILTLDLIMKSVSLEVDTDNIEVVGSHNAQYLVSAR